MSEDNQNKMPTLQDHIEELSAMHNHIVLSSMSMKLGRLIGMHIDQMDTYYVVSYPSLDAKDAHIQYESMVGGCFSLKETFPDYDWLSDQMEWQGAKATETFQLSADTREQFREMAVGGKDHPLAIESGEAAVKEYDEVIAPALKAASMQTAESE